MIHPPIPVHAKVYEVSPWKRLHWLLKKLYNYGIIHGFTHQQAIKALPRIERSRWGMIRRLAISYGILDAKQIRKRTIIYSATLTGRLWFTSRYTLPTPIQRFEHVEHFPQLVTIFRTPSMVYDTIEYGLMVLAELRCCGPRKGNELGSLTYHENVPRLSVRRSVVLNRWQRLGVVVKDRESGAYVVVRSGITDEHQLLDRLWRNRLHEKKIVASYHK